MQQTRTNSYKKVTSVEDTLNSFFEGTNLAHFFSAATNAFTFFCFYPITTFIIRYPIFSFLWFYNFAINLVPLCVFRPTHTASLNLQCDNPSHLSELLLYGFLIKSYIWLWRYTSVWIRNHTQHADVSEANFHPVLFLELLNPMYMNLWTRTRQST